VAGFDKMEGLKGGEGGRRGERCRAGRPKEAMMQIDSLTLLPHIPD